MNDELVLVDLSDPLVTILTLNRPDKRNALSIALLEAIIRQIEQANQDRTRRAIILRGAGPVFCAGLDLKEASNPALAHRSAETLAKMYLTLCESPLVTIVAAHGVAIGGGAGLVAAADFVVASDDLKIGYPEVHRGLTAALVTTLLRRQLADRQVRELTLHGQSVEAKRALSLGMITQLTPADQLLSSAMELARKICKGAPGAIARTKRLLDQVNPRTIREDLDRALAFHMSARNSDEAKEGVAAFLEKRAPQWGPRID